MAQRCNECGSDDLGQWRAALLDSEGNVHRVGDHAECPDTCLSDFCFNCDRSCVALCESSPEDAAKLRARFPHLYTETNR